MMSDVFVVCFCYYIIIILCYFKNLYLYLYSLIVCTVECVCGRILQKRVPNDIWIWSNLGVSEVTRMIQILMEDTFKITDSVKIQQWNSRY